MILKKGLSSRLLRVLGQTQECGELNNLTGKGLEITAEENGKAQQPSSYEELINWSRARRAREFSRQMAIHDAVTREKYAYEQGYKEGFEETYKESIYKTAAELVEKGMKIEAIAAMLDLNEDKLRKFLNDPDTQV